MDPVSRQPPKHLPLEPQEAAAAEAAEEAVVVPQAAAAEAKMDPNSQQLLPLLPRVLTFARVCQALPYKHPFARACQACELPLHPPLARAYQA